MDSFDWHWHAATVRARGCILICHGMAEHHHRYTELAHYLNQRGWHVLTYDHPGHGADSAHPGYLGNAGWDAMTDRLTIMLGQVKAHAGDLPLWLVGHSMGSFLVQDYASRFSLPDNCRGLVLVGTDSPQWLPTVLLRTVSGWLVRRHGARHVSPLLHRVTFGSFNRHFKPNRTDFDWLCSAPETVDAYLQDPACGFGISAGLWHELSQVLLRLRRRQTLNRIPSQLEVILMAGGKDPVGRYSEGPRALARKLRACGPGAELKLYPTLRHEILNETDKKLVWADLQRMVSDFTPRPDSL